MLSEEKKNTNPKWTLTFQHCWHLPLLSDTLLEKKESKYSYHIIFAPIILCQKKMIHLIFKFSFCDQWRTVEFICIVQVINVCCIVSAESHTHTHAHKAIGAGWGCIRGLWRTKTWSSLVVWLGFPMFEALRTASLTLSRSSKLTVCEREINLQL